MKRMTLSPTRGRTRWRHGGDYRSDMIRRQEEENETFCARSFLLDDALFWNFKRVSNAGNEKKMKDKLDDEIKLAGLESLVPEELQKHLILNSNRLRTFEDARLEVMTHVEAKFGLRIRDSKPSDTSSRGNSDPSDVDAVNSLSSSKGKGSTSPRDGVLSAVVRIFNEIAKHGKAHASNRMAKANRASHGPRSANAVGTRTGEIDTVGNTVNRCCGGLVCQSIVELLEDYGNVADVEHTHHLPGPALPCHALHLPGPALSCTCLDLPCLALPLLALRCLALTSLVIIIFLVNFPF